MDYNTKYLIFISADNNHNKVYHMIPSGENFTVKYGRVGASLQTATYPRSQWDKKYREKCAKGYTDRSNLVADLIESKSVLGTTAYKEIEDKAIKEIVERLQSMARKSISENYTIKSEAVTEKMVEEAQSIIDNLSRIKDVSSFNSRLEELFMTIPRKMSSVSAYLAEEVTDFSKIIQREQSTLDVMRGQIVKKSNKSDILFEEDRKEVTVLEENGLIFEKTTDEEVKIIKRLMNESAHKYCNSWKVSNVDTEKRFEKFCKEKNISNTKLLFHGSRNENFWSIIKTGLMIRPSNAVITGKLFGFGIYFAPKTQKSIGYTSLNGSYWARGNSNTGFLAIMEVAYGVPYDVYDFNSKYYELNYDRLKNLKSNADCLHAHAGANLGHSNLRNDEIIVYKEEQVTIKYLIEIKN